MLKLPMSLPKIKFFFTSKSDNNLAFHVGDNQNDVINNHKNLAIKQNYILDNLVYMKQIHSNIVKIIDKNDNFYNPLECDAIVTNNLHTPLMVMVADCTPILLYDENKSVIAAVHAGREGAFKNIVKNTLDAMTNQFDSQTKNIKVEIGVGICKDCYEVSDTIYNKALELNLEYAISKKGEKYFLDISKIILNQLLENGILKTNINIHKDCSCCDNEKYFSYRKEKQCGRFAGVIELV